MEFEFLEYKIFKVRYVLKHTQLFFFSCTRLKSKNWAIVEQALKIIKLNYYKVYNVSTNMILSSSIFKNNGKLIINGTTLFANLNLLLIKDESRLPLTTKLVSTHMLLTFLSAKINNKMYSNFQMQQISFLIYNVNLFSFCYLLKNSFKELFKSYFTIKIPVLIQVF